MFLSLLLWSTTVVLQDVPLTLSLRASRLENAVPAIAEKSGLNLKVDPAIKDLVVIVKVHDRPAKSVLRLVAEQVNASWVEQDDGSLKLVRRPEDVALHLAQQRALERQGVEAVKKRLREELGDGGYSVKDVEKFVAELERVNKPPEDGRGMSLDGPRLASPTSRLAKQLFVTVPTDDLLNVAQGKGLVLTETPNRRQSKANAPTLAAFDQFWKNVRVFVDTKSALFGASRGTGLDQSLVNLELPASGRGKTLAGVGRFNSTVTTYVRVFAANGDQFTEGFTLGESVMPPWKVPARFTAVKQKKFAVSPESALVQKFLSGTINLEGDFATGTDESRLLTLLRDPEHKDPLSFLVTDVFFAWADDLGLELVAHLPCTFDRYLNERGPEFELTDLWAVLERVRWMRVDERDGVMLVHPVSNALNYVNKGYAERVGRLNRGVADFEDRLDATAEFLAETYKATGEPGHGQWELMKWEGVGVLPRDWHQQGLYLLPLLGELPRPLRSSLRDGSKLEFKDLPPIARNLLNDTIGRWTWTSDTVAESHLSMHPTEHFPFGIPPDTTLLVEFGSDVALTTVQDVRFFDGMREWKGETSLRKVSEALKEPIQPGHIHPVLYPLSQSKRLYATRMQTLKVTFVAPDGSRASLQLQIPLERPQKTDLSPEQLVQKYFGGD